MLLQTPLHCPFPKSKASHFHTNVNSLLDQYTKAATLSLLNRLCKSFCNCLVLELEHFKQKLPEESYALPLSKALARFKKKLLGIITEPAKYPESLLSKDLITPLKPECQISMCSPNISLTFCSFSASETTEIVYSSTFP